ncbi:MAG: aminoacyl-histidine dipeptidase [Planctomycetota bacterium]
MNAVREIEPRPLWNHFADLNAVPRASKKEDQVIEFARSFGESLGLETSVDAVGNVIIRKAATEGMESRTPIVMQAHLDMVHQKNAGTDFDFATQGIKMLVEEDWIRADGTTLGADNGIGVATIMAVLSSSDIAHPALEALFTIDEETGMTGAKGLEGGMLHGKILLNLDTEEDNELTIGCAGGIDVSSSAKYAADGPSADAIGMRLSIRGLTGGHSGVDIHLGRGNANKLMNRLLWNLAAKFNIRVASIDGGGLRNAIPRESTAVFSVSPGARQAVADWIAVETEVIRAEYASTDPDCEIVLEASNSPTRVLPAGIQKSLLAALYAVPCGIHRMSPDIEDLVQTSNNLARVLVGDGELRVECLTRSSVNSERDDLANAITALLEILDGEVQCSGDYPGWQPKPEASIVQLMSALYQEIYGESAHVAACHAGLECGILGTNYPDMEMISFGPNIRGAHSPDERVQISSVQKFWGFLLETLKRIP